MDTNLEPRAASSLTSSEIRERITAEHSRLLAEQQIETSLLAQRIGPLEAGDDESLDRIESQINQTRDRQLRIQERLDLLDKRLKVAGENEHQAALDHMTRIGEAACEQASHLILHDYARLATELASVLERISTADALVEKVNGVLSSNGRQRLLSSNAVRCRPDRRVTEKVTRRVGPNEREHPNFGNIAGVSQGSSAENRVVYLKGGGEAPAFQEIEIEVERVFSGDRPDPLPGKVVLPGVGPAPQGHSILALWDGRSNGLRAGAIDELLAKLDASLKSGTPVRRES